MKLIQRSLVFATLCLFAGFGVVQAQSADQSSDQTSRQSHKQTSQDQQSQTGKSGFTSNAGANAEASAGADADDSLELSQTQAGAKGDLSNKEPAAKAKKKKKVYRVAIFIKNRAGKKFADKVSVFEDFLASRLSDQGFAVMSREDTINAVSKFAAQGPNQGQKNLKPDDQLDKILSDNTSALRLAQNMNADYLLVGSILTYGVDKRHFSGYGVDYTKYNHKLRLSYKVLDGVEGGTVSGDTVTAEDSTRHTPNLKQNKDMINNLLDQGSRKLVSNLAAKRREEKIRTGPDPKKNWARLQVVCGMQDMMVPQVNKTEDGKYIMGANKYQLEPVNVTVTLDGTAIGTAPGTFRVRPGLHKIRLSRPNFQDWANTINIIQRKNKKVDQLLSVSMKLTKQGRDEFMQMARFFQDLKSKQRLNEAQAKKIEGYAKMLDQSGLRVDIRKRSKKNINVDTNEAPKEVHQNVAGNQNFWDN